MTGVQTCALDRKSTRLNSSHTIISYAVFCLKKKQWFAPGSRTPGRNFPTGASLVAEPAPALVRRALSVALVAVEAGSPQQPSIFFLNDAAPTEFSPFPLPGVLAT